MLEMIEELLVEYGEKKEYWDRNLELLDPKTFLKAVEEIYGKFNLKNFKLAINNEKFYEKYEQLAGNPIIDLLSKRVIDKLSEKELIDKVVEEVFEKDIISKDEMGERGLEDFEYIKEEFKRNIYISFEQLIRKSKKISFTTGNGKTNISGRIILNKNDLAHLGITPNSKTYDMIWLNDNSILIKKSKKGDENNA